MRTTQVEGYSVDSAMDTDTDSWAIQIGDPNNDFTDVLERDSEVRVNLFGYGDGKIETLHSGFADEIVLNEHGVLSFQGRDITAVAVDSQHPPQIWHSIRPEILVAKEARQLQIGDRLKLTPASGFKTYATDGSESYWQVWYRFYRKRRMWMWAEPDGGLNAATLNYNQPISYYFGTPFGSWGSDNPKIVGWLPVETLEWRATKSQRVGEVYYFGHRGDVGFVARAVDPTTSKWIKRPTKIVTSGDVHNQAEARVEAWEEIFESKVGATEIKLLVQDPGFTIRQNTMAMVNIPQVGLRGEFFVVGVQIIGSLDQGLFQYVRLREKNYAISRRVPNDPVLKGQDVSEHLQFGPSGIAANLGVRWKWYFTAAANKYRGPWSFELFLAVLLSICEQESGFSNVRQGGHIEYPGTPNGEIPRVHGATWNAFVDAFANEISKGRVNTEWGVGPMQLTTPGYKKAADRLGGGVFDDELLSARWEPQWNIMAAAAALASKLGAGWAIDSDGNIKKAAISGLSLNPTEANIWPGVMAYNGAGDAAKKYMVSVKSIYNNTYKTLVANAVKTARADAKATSTSVPSGSSNELRQRVLNNNKITFTRQSQKDDIRYGRIHDPVLVFMLWLADLGFDEVITALKSDHSHLGSKSAHYYGLAVDIGNYDYKNINTTKVMELISGAQKELGFDQLIGPNPKYAMARGGALIGDAAAAFYGADTMRQHLTHIHVGWAITQARSGR